MSCSRGLAGSTPRRTWTGTPSGVSATGCLSTTITCTSSPGSGCVTSSPPTHAGQLRIAHGAIACLWSEHDACLIRSLTLTARFAHPPARARLSRQVNHYRNQFELCRKDLMCVGHPLLSPVVVTLHALRNGRRAVPGVGCVPMVRSSACVAVSPAQSQTNFSLRTQHHRQ